MARTVRDTNLETRSARLRLAVRNKPYWPVLETGLHLGYRRTKVGGGSWVARRFLGEGCYAEKGLGHADDLQDPDGAAVLSFKGAQEAARNWWKAREREDMGVAPETGLYSVADAIRDYFEAREHRGSKGVKADRHAACGLGMSPWRRRTSSCGRRRRRPRERRRRSTSTTTRPCAPADRPPTAS